MLGLCGFQNCVRTAIGYTSQLSLPHPAAYFSSSPRTVSLIKHTCKSMHYKLAVSHRCVHCTGERLEVISNLLISSHAPSKTSHTYGVRTCILTQLSLQIGTGIIHYCEYCVVISLAAYNAQKYHQSVIFQLQFFYICNANSTEWVNEKQFFRVLVADIFRNEKRGAPRVFENTYFTFFSDFKKT